MTDLESLRITLSLLYFQLRCLARERGSVTLEQVLVTTTLVAAALGTGAVIVAKVTDKARQLPLGTP